MTRKFTSTLICSVILALPIVSAQYLHPTTGQQNTYIGACPVTLCTGTYTDNGGSGGNYAANINATSRTFCAGNPGEKLQATFTGFSMNDTYFLCFGPNSCCDYLQIFDGPTYNSPMIYNNCVTSPGTVVGNSGCLTFRFTTDGSVQLAGWNATLACIPGPGGQPANTTSDCANATPLCSSGTFADAATGPGLVAEGCSGCITGETFSNWYSVGITTSGTLAFTIDPNTNSTDYDFAVFGPNASCGALGTPVRCSGAGVSGNGNTGLGNGAVDASEDIAGDQWVVPLNVTAGETYLILVNRFTNANPGFNFTFTGTAGLSSEATLSATPVNTCPGASTGQIVVGATGGVPPYNVAWSGPSNGNPAGTEIAASGGSFTIPALAAGTYTITVTNTGNCASTTTIATVGTTPINAGSITGTPTVCRGQFTPLSSTGDGGGVWSSNNEPVATVNSSGVVSGISNGTATITYTVTASGCTSSTSTIVTVNTCCPPANILYVNDDATGANTGVSWTDAFTDLQSALNSTCPGITEIWVAEGTYKPTSGADRSISFVMKNGVQILGGFPNTGDPGLGDRDWVANATTLSGEINTAAATDNSYHVIFNNFTSGSPLTGTAVLDGFTVTGGYASDLAPHCHGGGMYNLYASPIVTHCIFSNNTAQRSNATSTDSRGGGMYNSYSAPSVSYCTFSNNKARAVNGSGSSRGGGIFNEHATMSINHCTFSNNTTPNSDEDTYGGGICNLDMTIEINDCEFSGNVACFGGGVYSSTSAITVNNSTFSGNSLDTYPGGVNGSGMYLFGCSGSVSHSHFTGNLSHAGLGIESGIPITVAHCTFLNNPVYGMTLQSAAPILTNCLFAGNAFGGLANWPGGNSSPTLTNCTFSENPTYANLGAITNYGLSTATLKNCILWGDGPSVDNEDGGSVNISYSIVKQAGGVYPGTSNLNADPLFVSATDFHLLACSPAIDAGTDAGAPSDDLDSNVRPFDAAPNVAGNFDMGAYEYQQLLPPPMATCQNITVQLDANHSITVLAAQVNNGSTGCGNLTYLINSQAFLTFDCDDATISQNVTLTVTDVFNNTNDCSATITIADDDNPCCAAPHAICKPATVVLVGNSATLSAAQVDNGSTAACGLQSSTVSPNTFNCSHTGSPQTVTLTVTDINGDSDDCQATVTVLDQTGPTITCPANIVKSTDVGQCSAVTTYSVTASDNCAGSFTLTRTNGFASGTAFPTGVNVVNWQVTDAGGNSTACSFTVTVTDGQLPSIVCPVNISKTTDLNQCSAVTTYANPTFSDNCPGASVIRTSGQASGSAFPKGTTMVNWKATDASGNSSVCGFTVTVTDGQLPTITCPANIVKPADPGVCTAVVSYVNPTYTDNCTGAGLDHISGGLSGSTFPKGVTSVVWQATDATNLTKRCTFTITVNDTQAPAITCPANQSKSTDAGLCTAVATYTTPTFTDNCAGGTVTLQNGLASGAAFPKGINTVTWKATDAGGLTKTCTFRITVNDTQAPTISCPANQAKTTDPNLCTAVATYNGATFTDNCPGGTMVQLSGLASGSAFPKGVNNVVFKATDAAGNQSLCTMTVTVTDAQLPAITCPANIAVTGSISNGVCSATVTYTNPTATDNCGILSNFLLSGLASGSVFPMGVTTNTWKATDTNGWTATCAFTVSVGCGTTPETRNDELGTMNDELGTRNDFGVAPLSFIVHRLSFNIAPNPANTEVLISIEGLDERGGELSIFDATGQLIWQCPVAARQPSVLLDVSDKRFASAVYFVTLRSEQTSITKRLLVNRL